MTLSYLVSTAGHAQHQNGQHPHDVRSILQLIEEGAAEFADEKVVGFTEVEAGQWTCTRFSFVELLHRSDALACSLLERGVPQVESASGRLVSLLCPTGLDFLIVWIALMRLGYGVVFIAPQYSPSAIAGLLQSTASSTLVYHRKYAALAEDARTLQQTTTIELPTAAPPTPSSSFLPSPADPSSVSHVFHTSGTSGNPKPVPHKHDKSVCILPRRDLPSYLGASSAYPPPEPAAFTTTPLFHGGVSDLLRAWMARGMLYFYPTSTVPVTARHVVDAVAACQAPASPLPGLALDAAQRAERIDRFRVNAFLSVPYILTVLAEDDDATAMLATLDMVSTGGAPLDPAVGAGLVRRGVRLVSRLGSSECGFLLSSHRDYETEDDWEWLRNDSAYGDAIRFEPSGDAGKCEMVVTDGWRSKTKTNRDDGSYATGDLYEPHPTKPNVWRYAGRADDVIVMKASPGPIEAVFRASTRVADALVVGADRAELGLLVFPRPGQDVADDLPALLREANRHSPSFAQIGPAMCAVVDSAKALPKSSKGTVQRGVAYDVFKPEIEGLYGQREASDKPKRSRAEIEAVVRALVLDVAPRRLRPETLYADTDLFSWGVDSLMATRVRAGLQALNTGGMQLPLNVVFERPSLSRLAQYIHDLQEGASVAASDAHREMEAMVEKYGDFSAWTRAGQSSKAQSHATAGKTIVLTGATGSLGSFLAHDLADRADVNSVVCLARAADDAEADGRVTFALASRGMARSPKITARAAVLSQPQLGLDAGLYAKLAADVDVVIHAAWPVHFASTLSSFDDSVKGARNLLDLVAGAHRSTAHFFFLSSLASVLAGADTHVREAPSADPSTAGAIGYSQSKWVAEAVCARAAAATAAGGRGRVHVLRVGQLCGDTQTGHWNEKEGWPLLVRTAQTTGCLPELHEKPSWLPVDLASRAIVDIALGDADRPFIYHVVHPDAMEWGTILDSLRQSGIEFTAVPPAEWVRKVEASTDERSKQMLLIWKPAYGGSQAVASVKTVDVSHAKAASATLRDLGAVDQNHIGKMVAAWRKTGFLT
ncbi:hypothetical protein Q5752_005422 [Cryptotrichosporon argae]